MNQLRFRQAVRPFREVLATIINEHIEETRRDPNRIQATIQSIACRLGEAFDGRPRGDKWLYKCLPGSSDERYFPVEMIPALYEVTGDARIAEWVAEVCGAKVEASDTSPLMSLEKVMAETVEFMGTVRAALEDGRITKPELDAAMKEGEDAILAVRGTLEKMLAQKLAGNRVAFRTLTEAEGAGKGAF